MENTVSLEGALRFTKLSVRLVCAWPPPKHSTKWAIAREDIVWSLSLFSVFCLFVPLISSIYKYRKDSIIVTQTMCFCSACAMIILKTLLLRIHRKKFQTLIEEMEEFVKNCRAHERRVLQSYVDKCWMYHAVASFLNYLATFLMIVSPFVIPQQKMPTPAVYPFSIDSGVTMYLVFAHQSIVGLQTSAGLTVDCQMAMIMWFASARLEILADEIRDSPGVWDFRHFVKKHQTLLSYANKVSDTMSYIALTTTCVCGVASIVCCIQLASNQPLMVKLQYGPVSIVCLTNLMICAWPTENLTRVTRMFLYTRYVCCFLSFRKFTLISLVHCQSDLIGTSVYNIPWFSMSPKSTRDIIMILRSTQRPIQVSVSGFLPALSFRFYASFLSGVFSYFTTLRVVISND